MITFLRFRQWEESLYFPFLGNEMRLAQTSRSIEEISPQKKAVPCETASKKAFQQKLPIYIRPPCVNMGKGTVSTNSPLEESTTAKLAGNRRYGAW